MNIAIIISLQNSIGLFLEFAKKEKYFLHEFDDEILFRCQFLQRLDHEA